MLHLLPCLITFNIVEYLNDIKLNNWCGVSSICNSVHIELHLNCSVVCFTLSCHASLNWTCIILVCASCHVYTCVFTMLLASFRFASLVSFGFVPELWGFVQLRPFVFFMDSFFFLAGFQARWPYPRNHFYLCFARCSLFCYACAAIPTTCFSSLPNCHEPLTFVTLPSKPLFGYVTAFAQPLL